MHALASRIDSRRWSLVLAGGDGLRLRPLTRLITGDERPKQFCSLLGRETLLEQTCRRAALVVPAPRTLVVVTRHHERYYGALLSDMAVGRVVVQAENRGTAAAILYGIMRIAVEAPGASAAIFPSDHYVSDNAVFAAHVDAAFDAVRVRPDLVVLLGITPDTAEIEYGWIEPGEALPGGIVSRVRRFWEKPTLAVAQRLLARGGLWNSFVMIAAIPTLLALIRSTLPELYEAFASVEHAVRTASEFEIFQQTYSRIPSASFSEQVLAARPANLAVLPVRGLAWSDWGQPERVLGTLAPLGVRPEWATHGAPSVV